VLYTRKILELAEWAQKGIPVSVGPPLPPPTDWRFSNLIPLRAAQCRPAERQPKEVWALLQQVAMPQALREFVVRALWRKLAVAKRLGDMGIIGTRLCSLCGVVEDHEHALKKCRELSPIVAMVRGLWMPVVRDNQWYEPSRLCLEEPQHSLTTTQGLVMWSGILARWQIRCEVMSLRKGWEQRAVLQRLYAILNQWRATPRAALRREELEVAQEHLKGYLSGSIPRGPPTTDPMGWPDKDRAGKRRRATGTHREVLEQEGGQFLRVWVRTGRNDKGRVAYTTYYQQKDTRNSCRALPQGGTEEQAELWAVRETLGAVPGDVPLQLC
jgi:hypothetical protein